MRFCKVEEASYSISARLGGGINGDAAVESGAGSELVGSIRGVEWGMAS